MESMNAIEPNAQQCAVQRVEIEMLAIKLYEHASKSFERRNPDLMAFSGWCELDRSARDSYRRVALKVLSEELP
jgi:hypothetical protein